MPEFHRYQELISLSSAEVPMKWSEMLGHNGAFYLLYKFRDTEVFSRCHCKVTRDHNFVTEEEFLRTQVNIQWQFSGNELVFPSFMFALFFELPNFFSY